MTCLAGQFVKTLNDAMRCDHEAIQALVTSSYVKCNEELADHPSVVCGEIDGNTVVGPVGLINGLLTDYYKAIGEEPRLIAMKFNEDNPNEITGFCHVAVLAKKD